MGRGGAEGPQLGPQARQGRNQPQGIRRGGVEGKGRAGCVTGRSDQMRLAASLPGRGMREGKGRVTLRIQSRKCRTKRRAERERERERERAKRANRTHADRVFQRLAEREV